jgi:SAM-dependent methyltransferase
MRQLVHELEAADVEQARQETERSAAMIARAIRAGMNLPDTLFDAVLEHEHRSRSTMFWTPVAVACEAARWLTHFGARSVLDVGSGVGKFAVLAALAQSQLTVIGVEHRASLVRAARTLAQQFLLDGRVRFIEGEYASAALPHCDALYLFNPFGENLFDDGEQLDDSVARSFDRFREDSRAVTEQLKRAPIGALLCTYNGFGGKLPQSFELLRHSDEYRCPLRLWRKRSMFANGPDMLEEDLALQGR